MSSGIKRNLILSVPIVFLSLFISTAQSDLHQQRQCFVDAESAFKEGNQEKFNKLLSSLKGYPLYPYLVFLDIRKNMSLDKENEILSFISEYRSSPLSGQLRESWLNCLCRQNQWQRLVMDYRAPASQSLQCSYARALLETGEIDKAWIEAEKLWLHGQSRPRECDPVFEAWRAHKKLTPDLVWQRIELSMAQNETRLTGYLKQYLPSDEKPWVDLWLNILKRPAGVLDTDWSNLDRWVAGNILTQGMGMLIRQDTPEAALAFDKSKAEQDLSKLDTSRIEQEIALYLALRRHPQALERMNSLPDHLMTPTLREWRIRAALFRQDWKAVLSAWEYLDVMQKAEPRWLYWKARALEALGRFPEASAIYQEILGRQNYFSLLAADRLKEPCRISHRPLSAAAEDILNLRQEPGIQRAFELFYLGRMVDARREWIFSLQGKGPSQMKAAAIMAHDLGWHDRAIVAAANAGEYDDLVLRFPLTYSELINQYAGKTGLDPVWVLALIRQESMFMADVSSPAGALGVMQIMPATGRRIASMLGEHFPHRSLLISPENNIRFGTLYLGMRFQELQGNPVLASAAYNAGASRVRDWLPEEGSIPADIWVEIIPFFETRRYIEMIFTYQAVYRQRLGIEQKRLSDLMPDIFSEKAFVENIRRFSPSDRKR
jgi:soluble lytic murein transglycosylase